MRSIPFYEVFGWATQDGTALNRLLEFLSNFYIFNSIITGDTVVLIDATRHLILPALALATIPLAIIARMTRSSLLDVLGERVCAGRQGQGGSASHRDRQACVSQRLVTRRYHHRAVTRESGWVVRY